MPRSRRSLSFRRLSNGRFVAPRSKQSRLAMEPGQHAPGPAHFYLAEPLFRRNSFFSSSLLECLGRSIRSRLWSTRAIIPCIDHDGAAPHMRKLRAGKSHKPECFPDVRLERPRPSTPRSDCGWAVYIRARNRRAGHNHLIIFGKFVDRELASAGQNLHLRSHAQPPSRPKSN